MGTVEIIRTVVGVSLILFGLGVYVFEKLYYMKYTEFRYSPIDWVFCIGGGVYAIAYTVKSGVISLVVAFVLWVATKMILTNSIKKKEI